MTPGEARASILARGFRRGRLHASPDEVEGLLGLPYGGEPNVTYQCCGYRVEVTGSPDIYVNKKT